jgi:NAD-reducing hydrogenase large subunit
MRRLMHYGQVMQSHVLHFFHLAAPDLLFGFGAPAEKRNIFEVIKENPELGRRAVLMRKFGQEIIEATAGKKIHGTGAIPGGINRNLPIERRDHFLSSIDQMTWNGRKDAVKLARDYTLEHEDLVAEFARSRRTTCRSCATATARSISITASLRALSSTGDMLFDKVPYTKYHELIVEDVRSWSYMKFPFIRELGPEAGWYRVGPLARMNTASFIDTPLADAAHKS